MANSRVHVSFIVPVLNDARRLERCLNSIVLSSEGHAVELIVADGGSADDSARVASSMGATVLVLPGGSVARMRNRAVEAASGQILAFVDADHEIERRWVPSAIEALALRGVGAAGAFYRAPVDGTWVQRMYDGFRERAGGRHPVEWLASGNLAVWREAFMRCGGFDISLQSCEDVDFCRRLRRLGYQILSDDRLESTHLGDPRTLSALFLGELWRGRDNLRTSFRGPLTWRGMPSVLIPMVDLAMIAAGVAGLLVLPERWWVSASAACVVAGLSGLRTLQILARIRSRAARDLIQAFAVAAVYDLARALAAVCGASYRVRRMALRT